jgi:Mg-chelatase subunit ChlD
MATTKNTTTKKPAAGSHTTTPTETLQDALLVLVVDRSGSMETIRDDMQGGLNSLLAEQAKLEGRCFVTLAQFDDSYEVLADAYRLVPRGSTALLDAIGRTVSTTKAWLDELPAAERPRVLFTVITDGMENASREWSRQQVMDAVTARQGEGWDFTFLGANQDAIHEGSTMGFSEGSSITYSRMGTAAANDVLSKKLRQQRTAARMEVNYSFSPAERAAAAPDLDTSH